MELRVGTDAVTNVSTTCLVRIFFALLICIAMMLVFLGQNLSRKNIRVLPSYPAKAIGVLQHSTRPTTNRTVHQHLNEILIVLRPFIHEIQDTGKELLAAENAAPTEIEPSVIEINGLYEGYFDTVNSISSVRTIFFRKDFKIMKKLLSHDYHEYSSNDCEYLAERTKPTNPKAFIQPNEYLNCVSKKDSMKGQPLNKEDMAIGLPFKYQHQLHNETWTFIHVIQNAILASNGFIRTANVTLIPQQCEDLHGMNDWPSDIDSIPVYDEVFSITQFWAVGFYHFTHEAAPRLAPYIQLLNNNLNIKIVVHSPSNWPMYSLFGIKDFEDRLIKERHFRAKVLYSPAGGPCGKSPIFTTHLLSLYARQSLPNTQRNRIILIKRSHKRFFRHHDDIARMLQEVCRQYDLDFYVFSDDPLPDAALTMKVFNEALIVVAPHGAGSSNMIYSQPGTVLIEGTHWNANARINPCYRAAAHALGHIFYGVINKYPTGVFEVTSGQVEDPVIFFLERLIHHA